MTAGDLATEVVAVVVAYAPEPMLFARLLAAASKQVESIVVVDNGRGAGLQGVAWTPRVELVDMNGNSGVAAALNAGIRRAFQRGATHALLLDHDSVPAAGMTAALLDVWRTQSAAGCSVATVGANYRDGRRPDVSPFIRIDGFRLHRIEAEEANAVSEVSYVISSGSLISRDAFEAVGPMNESLFIDYIDIEWGLRAALKCWVSYGAHNARLEHVLGDVPLTIFGTSYPLRSPLRHYYMVRNAVWLIVRASLPVNWKFVEGLRLLRRVVAYATFAPQRHRHMVAMFRGLCDGLAGRMGNASSERILMEP